MGLQQSKEELLYQQVNYGNVEGIKALHRDGAGLEWVDKEGKTPLILACMRPDGLQVAQTLIELGANLNAYRPGRHAGNPLHHAAKRGLEQTVLLLLSHGANALKMNDDCLTALDLARAKGHCNVVRAIENHISLFSGWLRELYGPSFLEALTSQWLQRRIWAVVLPRDHRNPLKPLKLELVIYPELQVAQPRTTIELLKVKLEELNINQLDPVVVIYDKNTRTRYKFLSAHEGDKQQLMWFYNACRGMPQQVIRAPGPPEGPPGLLAPTLISAPPASAPSSDEDPELAMAISASIKSAAFVGVPPFLDPHPVLEASNINGMGRSEKTSHSGWETTDQVSSSSGCSNLLYKNLVVDAHNGRAVPEPVAESARIVPHTEDTYPTFCVPSAPPVTEEMFGSNIVGHQLVDLHNPVTDHKPGSSGDKETGNASSSCVVCLDAPVEGACVPCGHMAGCMSCLNEIKAKEWGCPICRSKIEQVIRLFAV